MVYGPVPSRRLGRSLGINNIPPKRCSYSCVYCQLGNTLQTETQPGPFYSTEIIAEKVRTGLEAAGARGEKVDYVSFVADGEPALDINLGKEIDALKGLGVRIAVITNGSLLWHSDVRQNLLKADWVSLKVDAVSEQTWHRINRPHESLRLTTVLQGIFKFAAEFGGELTTETMMIQDINDDTGEIERVADFLTLLKPVTAYVAIPTRPPAEHVKPAGRRAVNAAYQVFADRLGRAEYLIEYEGNEFACSDDLEEDLLAITAVHPIREEAAARLLEKAGADWGVIENLIDNGRLVALEYQGKKFYVRRLAGRGPRPEQADPGQ
ncbi:MAG: radical SAM protein [Dehalococcoidia bacterium]|nr:radical SAM protein [Dehalococcoidia bacterium]